MSSIFVRGFFGTLLALAAIPGCAAPTTDSANPEETKSQKSDLQITGIGPTISATEASTNVDLVGRGFTQNASVEVYVFYQFDSQWVTSYVRTSPSCFGPGCTFPFAGGTFTTSLACPATTGATYYARDLATGTWSNGVNLDLHCAPH